MSGDISSVLAIIAPSHARGTAQRAVGGNAAIRQEASEDDLQPARNGLDALIQAKANQKQQRKSFARAKVERLKHELDGLRLSGGANPKGAARRAVQIARELGAAGREYARVHVGHLAGATTQAKDDMGDVAEALIQSTDAFLRQDSGIGAGSRFATKIRQLFTRARNVVDEQRRRAEEDGRDDREYVSLAGRTRVLGIAIDHNIAGSAVAPPLNIEI